MVYLSQRADVDGRNNVTVQVDNSQNVTISVGAVSLTLEARHKRQRPPQKPLDLLDPKFRAIPFVGREDLLADLDAWLDSDWPIAARCLTGRAGSGKTRLAIELCARADDHGWHAGFINDRDLTRFSAQHNLAVWAWARPTLLVVDYAAARARELRVWLDELADNPDDPERPLRLLLLERHADPQVGWWPDLTRASGFSDAGIEDLFDPLEPLPLPTITQVDQRRAILTAVMAQASKMEGREPPVRPPKPGADPAYEQTLAKPDLDFEPLYLLMAGLAAVESGVATVLGTGRKDLAERLARFELGRVARVAAAHGVPEALATHLAAIVTLRGGVAEESLRDLIKAERRALDYDTASIPDTEHALLAALPATEGTGVAPILPDLIGEAAVLEGLRPLAEGAAVAAIRRSFAASPRETIASIIRTAQDYADATDHLSLLWFDAVVANVKDLRLFAAIAEQLPRHSVALRERAAEVEQMLLAQRKSSLGANPPVDALSLLALSLNDLSNRLCVLGRLEEALTAIEEAVAIRRNLATARPDAFRPGLALSLNNLSLRLSNLGRRQAAFAAIEEAVGLYRNLATARSEDFRPGLAMSLNNLSLSLVGLARREEALGAVEQAVDLYRDLATARPENFRPEVALSLNNLSKRLRALGRREEALQAIEEAVAVRRDLAAARPDAFRPDLAHSLSNLSLHLSDLGRREEALSASQEAVAIHRDLAAAWPDAFGPDLARSLLVLAGMLEGLDRVTEAVAANREAVEMLSPYFLAHLPAFAGLMGAIAREYIRRCEAQGQEPDAAVLGPIDEGFRRLNDQNDGDT